MQSIGPPFFLRHSDTCWDSANPGEPRALVFWRAPAVEAVMGHSEQTKRRARLWMPQCVFSDVGRKVALSRT